MKNLEPEYGQTKVLTGWGNNYSSNYRQLSGRRAADVSRIPGGTEEKC